MLANAAVLRRNASRTVVGTHTRNGTIMKRLIIGLAVGFVAAAASVGGAAEAGRPNNTGCYGESISTLAKNQASPGGFGAGVVGFAQAPDGHPGLGDGVQALQAGLVGDDVVPNTCNDA
jgi:hypothetical protein